jgi:hypothetical protein
VQRKQDWQQAGARSPATPKGQNKMKKLAALGTLVWALIIPGVFAAPAQAQEQAKDKPPMYTYVANWAIPRAQWGEMEKNAAANQGILDKALADGALVGFGSDIMEVHQAEGITHDSWWSSMSMAGVLGVLDKFGASGTSTTNVLASATKHADFILVSRHYNWHSGSYKGAYTRESNFRLKADAPNDAIETLCNSFFVPLFEKMLADGTILEYEIDTEAVHTDNPSQFFVVFVTPNAEGLDKFDAALSASQKANSLAGPAFAAMVDFTTHRDQLLKSVGTYK